MAPDFRVGYAADEKMRRPVGDRRGIGGVCGGNTGTGEAGPDQAKTRSCSLMLIQHRPGMRECVQGQVPKVWRPGEMVRAEMLRIKSLLAVIDGPNTRGMIGQWFRTVSESWGRWDGLISARDTRKK